MNSKIHSVDKIVIILNGVHKKIFIIIKKINKSLFLMYLPRSSKTPIFSMSPLTRYVFAKLSIALTQTAVAMPVASIHDVHPMVHVFVWASRPPKRPATMDKTTTAMVMSIAPMSTAPVLAAVPRPTMKAVPAMTASITTSTR